MIAIDRLSFRYGDGTPALDDVTLEVPRGEIFALVGRSGSGKTTLLRCLGRFAEPRGGSIRVEGRPLARFGELELRQTLGIVFQELYLFPHLTVLENLTLAPIRAMGERAPDAAAAARGALERLGIGELAGRRPDEVSGGQAQRVAIARALVLRPAYLLLDEPTSALDPHTAREFGDWLLDLRDQTTFVVVTHDAGFARRVAGRGALLESGRIAARGDVDRLLSILESGKYDRQPEETDR